MNGMIIPNQRRTNKIAARFGGRIEKLYVRFPFQHINKGEKLLELYSPELITAISEYLFLLKKEKTSSLVVQSRQKLVLLGLTDSQLNEFEKSGTAPQSIVLYSPYSGYVISSEPTQGSATSMQQNSAGGMSGMNQLGDLDKNNSATTSSAIREGAYITSGQTLFEINDAKEVVALLSVTSGMQASIKTGMPVDVVSELAPGAKINGTINLIEPVLEAKQRFLAIRIQVPNPNGVLKFNSLARGEIKLPLKNTFAVPSSCVFDLGKRKIVWVKTDSIGTGFVFTPRIIVAGNNDGINTEILSGLKPGEEIAIDAGLLVDREGIIQTEQQ